MQKLLLLFVCLSFGCVVVIQATDCDFNTTALNIIQLLPIPDIYTIVLLNADQIACLLANGFINGTAITANVTIDDGTNVIDYPLASVEARVPILLEIAAILTTSLGLPDMVLSLPLQASGSVVNYPIQLKWDGSGHLKIIV